MNEWMNEWGFRAPLCTYKMIWARRTPRWWWDNTALQTKDSKFKPWTSEAEHATSRSPRLPTILKPAYGHRLLLHVHYLSASDEHRNQCLFVSTLKSAFNNYLKAFTYKLTVVWPMIFSLFNLLSLPVVSVTPQLARSVWKKQKYSSSSIGNYQYCRQHPL